MSRKKSSPGEKISSMWRKLRLSMDLGQKDFGELLGVGAGYISEIESGKKEPSVTLQQLFNHIAKGREENRENDQQTNQPQKAQEREDEEDMFKEKFLELSQKHIMALEENIELRKRLADSEPEKKARAKRKVNGN